MQFVHSKNKKELLVGTLAYGFSKRVEQSRSIEEATTNIILCSKFYIDLYSDHISEQDSMIGLWIYTDTLPTSWNIAELKKITDRSELFEISNQYFQKLPQEIKDLRLASKLFEHMEFESVGGYTKAWNNLVEAVNTAYENLLDSEDKKQYRQLVEQVGEPVRDWGEDEEA